MTTIYKYTVQVTDAQVIELPKKAQILAVQAQKSDAFASNSFSLWALVDTKEEETEKHRIHVYGTGHPVDNIDMKYLGTIQLLDGRFVGHVFVEINNQ